MTTLADLGPLAQLRAGRLPRRLTQLLVGLWLYGVSLGLMVRGNDGVAPWDVLHLGIVGHTGLDLGTVLVIMSFVVLLFWIPLREKPGIGTIANALLIGPSTDLTLAVVHPPHHQIARVLLMLAGVGLCALATALYIGAQFGRGPRDGLMTGLVRRTGLSIRLIRTALEISVVVVGLLLGGPIGVGTVVFALAIGPLTQVLLPTWIVALDAPTQDQVAEEAESDAYPAVSVCGAQA
ncbi:hypothetical protein P5P86_10745 [Nocardioides sp. BP30]|uniref:membrane protein YczE n=1 Tax=Nocardioides sp. BP30 TaxID=3036374 RepID=UPI0024686B41|nr:hypothetical protein [Nocardioides sp. BP30]WGL50445.1 hypothetical protein P5P86_10745 [Nocardioides sp. BP30]